jgi:O-antigen/teichoic acid export membrane protein
MAKPALSLMLFPLTNALSFQGMTLLAGYELGPVAVTIFNTYRTLARVAVQATGIFSHALWPEFSLIFGRAGAAGILLLYHRTAIFGVALAVGLSVALYFSGPCLLNLWTHGRIAFQAPLMVLMLIYAAIGGAWHIPRILLLSTNEHTQLAFWSASVAAGTLVLAETLCWSWKIEGLATAMVVSELALALISARLVQHLLYLRNSTCSANSKPV